MCGLLDHYELCMIHFVVKRGKSCEKHDNCCGKHGNSFGKHTVVVFKILYVKHDNCCCIMVTVVVSMVTVVVQYAC